MRTVITLISVITCLSVTGCNPNSNSGTGPVAVVDLDAVAQKLGLDKQILQKIEQRQISLNEQVVAIQNSLIQQLNQKKSEFGEVTPEEAKQLAELQNKANSILATTRTQAQSNLTKFQLDMVNRFRAEVKPIALELASKKGCRVVLSRNDSVVFAFDETIDLTDEVTAELRSKAVSSSPADSPVVKTATVRQASADVGFNMKK